MKRFGFDLLFEVQVPRPWTEGKERDKFYEALEQAVFAEQMGFDTVWMVEHHFLQQFAHSSAPEVMLGSVHAVTESGALLAASMSGSQLGPYASGAGRVILVVGTQKIVSDLEEGLRRINDYSFPLEDARAQAAYGIRSAVNKVLIINREIVPDRITVVLVDEALGF